MAANGAENDVAEQFKDALNQQELIRAKELLESSSVPIDLEKDCGQSNTYLHTACMWKDPGMIRLLLEHGANPFAINCRGSMAMHIIAELGDVECLHVFWDFVTSDEEAKNKLDIDVENRDGKTALFIACEENNPNCLRFLLEKGANPNVMSRFFSRTPLHCACEANYQDCAQLLLSHGANVEMTNSRSETCLAFLARTRKKWLNGDCFQLLLRHGAKPNQYVDSKPLMFWVCTSGSFTWKLNFRLLLRFGANINGTNEYGDTLLHFLCRHGKCPPGVMQFVLEKGADPKRVNTEERSPLYFACGVGDLLTVKSLLEYGANPVLPDKHGVTPLANAEHGNHADCVNAIQVYMDEKTSEEEKEDVKEPSAKRARHSNDDE